MDGDSGPHSLPRGFPDPDRGRGTPEAHQALSEEQQWEEDGPRQVDHAVQRTRGQTELCQESFCHLQSVSAESPAECWWAKPVRKQLRLGKNRDLCQTFTHDWEETLFLPSREEKPLSHWRRKVLSKSWRLISPPPALLNLGITAIVLWIINFLGTACHLSKVLSLNGNYCMILSTSLLLYNKYIKAKHESIKLFSSKLMASQDKAQKYF
jgi:hypothetical protein